MAVDIGRPHPGTVFSRIDVTPLSESTDARELSGRGASTRDPCMPLYFFRIRNGRYSGASEFGTECADRNAAWKALTSTCADMAAGISRKLKQNSEWHMELLDESKRPIFRIRIVAESLD
jgi:Domain of unknown function (DUF6894)